MRLAVDVDRIADFPGEITTEDGQFVHASLRAIPQVAHDQLATFQFGDGRVRNLLCGVEPAQGTTAMAILSLLDNGNAEVRIVRGAPLAPQQAPPSNNESPLFGIFPLSRQKGTCGF